MAYPHCRRQAFLSGHERAWSGRCLAPCRSVPKGSLEAPKCLHNKPLGRLCEHSIGFAPNRQFSRHTALKGSGRINRSVINRNHFPSLCFTRIAKSGFFLTDSLAPPAHPARTCCAGQVAGVAIRQSYIENCRVIWTGPVINRCKISASFFFLGGIP